MLELFLAPAAATLSQPVAATEQTEDLPHAVKRMISVALRFDDEVQRNAVISAAKSAYPQHSAQIDWLVAELGKPVEPLRIAPLVVPAPEPVDFEPPGYWEDLNAQLTLNAAETRGNTDTLYLGLHGKLNLKRRAQIHRLETHANIAEANGVESQKNWGLSYQLDTLWTDVYFGYIRGSIDRDNFSGFETDAFAGIGAGVYLLQTHSLSLRSEFGPGYRYLALGGQDRRMHALGLYGSTEFDWLIDEDWTFEIDTRANISGPTSTFEPTMRMSTSVSQHVSAGLSYDLRYESNPPLKSENLDRILKFDVKYSY